LEVPEAIKTRRSISHYKPDPSGNRIFARLLRKADVDTMTIEDLGRWESLEMVAIYHAVSFNDSLKFYKTPLGCG